MADDNRLEAWARAFLAELVRRELVTLVNPRSVQSVLETLAFLFGEEGAPQAAAIAEHLIDHEAVVDLHCDDDTIAAIVRETEPVDDEDDDL